MSSEAKTRYLNEVILFMSYKYGGSMNSIPERVNLWTTWIKSKIMRTPRFRQLNWVWALITQCVRIYRACIRCTNSWRSTLHTLLMLYSIAKTDKLTLIVSCSLLTHPSQFTYSFIPYQKCITWCLFPFFVSIAWITMFPWSEQVCIFLNCLAAKL